MFFCQEVAVEVAVEDMLVGEEAAPEELAVALEKLVVWHALTFLDGLFETTYFVHGQELEAGEEGVGLQKQSFVRLAWLKFLGSRR